ncbi:MAG: 16S rRNA (cytidine(1402)-2'-O)-methyltransferase [Firmicutes bacterium]|nr:16S rRNA (cytidine(1402)-2'-O)-methyltransferase [Bacillota bacterium]
MSNEILPGALYVVATPIGNLSDLSARAVKVLSEVDFIAAEDTRVTLKLLTHFGIKKPLVSYYEQIKAERGPELCARLSSGESCALVSDAGTPAISDPGEDLVRLCREKSIPVYIIPGCCAAVSALAVSGLPTARFSFEGFIPVAKKERLERLDEIRSDRRTLIFYEAPHRLKSTLADLYSALGDRRISLVRELTKINEEVIATTLSAACGLYRDAPPKGEFVLIVEGASENSEQLFWRDMTVREHYEFYKNMGLEHMAAVKKVASDRGIAKNEVYMECIDAGKSRRMRD